MSAHFGPRPMDSGDGGLAPMPKLPLPSVLRDEWNPLASVIDEDGHAIVEPAR